MRNIVVGIEFPIQKRKVIEIAMKMAKEFAAKLFIIHTESVDSYINHIVVEDQHELSQEVLEEYRHNFEKQMQNLQDELASKNIESECILADGFSASEILKIAEKVKADMIILGSHEHGKFYELVLGSTHDLLIKKSTIPVLVIPPHMKE